MDDNKDEKVNNDKDLAEYFQLIRENEGKERRKPHKTEEVTEEYDAEGRLIKKTTITRSFSVAEKPHEYYLSNPTYTTPYYYRPRVSDWFFRW